MTDYLIVGGGPSGLTVAWELAKAGFTAEILEKHSTLGGLHRVMRTDQGLFREHGPRIYSTSYVNFASLWAEMMADPRATREAGPTFQELFTPYRFQISSIGGQTFWDMTWREKVWLTAAFLSFLVRPHTWREVTLQTFLETHQFSTSTRDYLDRVARLTDGAGADRYSMFTFFQLLNQNFLNQLLQPIQATDRQLITEWKRALAETGKVSFRLNTTVTGWSSQDGLILENGETLRAKRGYIFALPPQDLFAGLIQPEKFSTTTNWTADQWRQWDRSTRYDTYIPMTFHWWNFPARFMPAVYGFPKSDWGVAWIVLSDYFSGKQGVLISASITLPNAKSTRTGLTAHQTVDENQLKREVFRQIRQGFSDQPSGFPVGPPDYALLSPEVYYQDGQWKNRDHAWIRTTEPVTFPVDLGLADQDKSRVYSVGTHNGNSPYDFTSLESAVTNALVASQQILGRRTRKIKRPWEIRTLLGWILLSVALIFVVLRFL